MTALSLVWDSSQAPLPTVPCTNTDGRWPCRKPVVSVGLARCEAHHYSVGGVGGYVGVTTAIKAVDKSDALVGWAKRETAACAVRNLPMVTQMVATGGPKAAIDWLKSIPDYQRDKAADLGSRVHRLAESIAKGEDVAVGPDEASRVEQYIRWRESVQPEVLDVEYAVVSLKHQYGGTGDLWCRIDRDTWAIDIKSSASGVYSESSLQLAGLGFAEQRGAPGEALRPNPRPKRYGLLWLSGTGPAKLVELAVTRETFAAFLETRRLYAWVHGQAAQFREDIRRQVVEP